MQKVLTPSVKLTSQQIDTRPQKEEFTGNLQRFFSGATVPGETLDAAILINSTIVARNLNFEMF